MLVEQYFFDPFPSRKSATLQIEGKTVCVRDDKQWKDCSSGHETADWVRQIEQAYDEKNLQFVMEDVSSLVPTATLHKRQDNNTSSTTSPGPPPPNNNPNQGQGAPLSVFVSVSFTFPSGRGQNLNGKVKVVMKVSSPCREALFSWYFP